LKNVRALLGMIAIFTTACGESDRPTAPTQPSPVSGAAATLKGTGPTPVSPTDGSRVGTRQPTLVVTNPTLPYTPIATVRLRFVVQDAAGATLHASAPIGLGDGTTSYTVPIDLDHDRSFRWFAEVLANGDSSPAFAARSFVTPPLPAPAAAATVDNCPGTSPLAIVTCQRERTAGRMDASELLAFVRAVAKNLNDNGIPNGPFGVLRKANGANCDGYSCDVLCAGQGGGQRQWDILLDMETTQTPLWSGPHQGNIRLDVCEAP
jgi:hypothetical protein